MVRMEVRCCCNANICYGTVKVDAFVRAGQRVEFNLRPADGLPPWHPERTNQPPERIALEVAELWEQHDVTLAVKSMHEPRSVIERIDSFEPVSF